VPPHATWQSLKDLMRAAGSVRRVEVQNSGRPYATVEFDDAQSAQNAITMFNDFNFEGQQLHVREDREAGGGQGLVSNNQEHRVFVSNLPFRAEWQELKDICAPYGRVVRADVEFLPDGRSKGCGSAVFSSRAEAWACIRGLDGQMVEGRALRAHGENDTPASKRDWKTTQQAGPISSNQDTRIFVSGLPYRAAWQELKDICAPFGNVVRADVDLLPDGRSKGCGTVVFSSQAEALACIRGLDGQFMEGRPLGVKAQAGATSGAPTPGFKVFVGNLPFGCNWQTLKDMGRPFGEVLFADLALEPSGRSRGFGVLTFAQPGSARACIANLHGSVFEGRDLTVHEDNRNSF